MTDRDDALLDADVSRLTSALDSAIAELSGQAVLDLVRELRQMATALRQGTLAGGRDVLQARFARLDLAAISDVARAFTLWFHLVNAAEEHHRVRMLRRHTVEHPAQDSLAMAIEQMAAAGMDAEQVLSQIRRLFVMPVLTAHPTEARRRTLRDHLAEVKRLVDALERPKSEHDRRQLLIGLANTVEALYGTDEARARKPSPRDEIDAGLDVFVRTLLDATPAFYRELESTLARAFPEHDFIGLARAAPDDWVVPSFFRWGTWIGGDRDGNPFVTAHVTRRVLEQHRRLVLERYLRDVDQLGRQLSISSGRVRDAGCIAELQASLTRDRERFPEIAARIQRLGTPEPWREKLSYMAARLRATLDRSDEAYVDCLGYQRDLLLLERSLTACGYARLATGSLRDARRRADSFGFHLASLDLRQHSDVHERVADELVQALRLSQRRYRDLSEAERCELLHRVLSAPWPLTPSSRSLLSAETQDLLATLDVVGRARRDQGSAACPRYITSFTRSLSDLLEVLLLQRAAGLSPGELKPVPLLEQLEDLEQAGRLASQMLSSGPIRAALGGELEVMIGYSDSCKQVGYVTSQAALRRAQHALADVVEAEGLLLTIFHGRGGAIGRGGGPAHQAIRAQPERALRGRLRVTEQGETIFGRYSRQEIAQRELEQTVSAVLLSGLSEQAPLAPSVREARDRVLERASEAAHRAYARLLADPDRLARYARAATPIGEVTALPIGSRPASRKQGVSLADLRAIPWVFSWNQSRHGVPGWFGLGTALQVLIDELGLEGVRALFRESPFFRALINNAELALTRADIEVAGRYAALADPEAQAIFPIIQDEWDRTVSGVLSVIDKQRILGNRPHLLATVDRRNPYVDILSHAQIELRRRLLADPPAEEREPLQWALFTTINGIAAGLQTAG